ncbi:MAG: gamma carbonic anhydrase family protein [Pirellulaceae bacterium]
MPIYQFGDDVPELHPQCFIAETATIIGRVRLAKDASIWPSAVLRGDIEWIDIGPRTSVQDGVVMHTDPGAPLTVGADVTIGHQATLHGCTIGDGSLIGMQAIVLNRTHVGRDCLVGAGALITEGKAFPDRSLILGSPAKVVRELSDAEVEQLRQTAERYVNRAADCRERLKRLS